MSLPFEHIRYYRRNGRIKPVFIREPLGILDTLIEVYSDHVDKKRGELEDVLADCEHLGYNYKQVRGLAAVLESRAVFQSRSSIPPLEARGQVFTEAASTTVTTREERLEVMERVAERHEITVEELEDSLYADLNDEQYLVDFTAPTTEMLMKFYNYANMVALLAYALSIDIVYRGEDTYLENLVNRIKNSEITESDRKKISMELKPTSQVSYRAGKLDEILRRVIVKPEWSLRASIKYPKRYKTACLFQITSDGDGEYLAVDKHESEMIIEIPLQDKKISKYGEVVVVEEVAQREGVTRAQIINEIENEGIDYIDLGGVLVSPDKHSDIENQLKSLPSLGEAQSYLRSLGVRDFMAVLESYGYQVEWSKPRKDSRLYRL